MARLRDGRARSLLAWPAGRRAKWVVAALWLVAPTMVFTFVPYTEALFCAFAAACSASLA